MSVATRIHDEKKAATVVEVGQGRVRQSGGARMSEPVVADGSESLPEPVLFSSPTAPNKTLLGSFFMVDPETGERSTRLTGTWERITPTPIRVVNGHVIARTKGEYERIKAGCRECIEEPPSAERPKDEAGKDRPFKFFDGNGKVLFWTYRPEVLERFQRHYLRQRGD